VKSRFAFIPAPWKLMAIVAMLLSVPASQRAQERLAFCADQAHDENDEERSGAFLSFVPRVFPSIASSYWEAELGNLERIDSKFGYSIGGEIELCYRGFWVRGMYQAGSYEFETSGTARQSGMGIDVGICSEASASVQGIFAIGYHDIQVQRDYKRVFSPDNSDLESKEAIIVIGIRSKPRKSGFIFSAEFDFNLMAMPSHWAGEDEHMGMAFILDLGVRFAAIPLCITLGGEVRGFQLDYNEEHDRNCLSCIFEEAKVDAVYGATLKVSYALAL